MRVLSASACLLRVFAVHIGHSRNSLFVGDLRSADISLDLELSQETVNDDLQMELTHSGDDGLTRFRICISLERWVFLSQLGKRDAHLFLTDLGLRLYRDLDNRIREFHRLKHYRVLVVAECVARCRKLETYRSSDVSGKDCLELASVIGVHLQDTSESLLAVFRRVVYVRARIERARVYPEERQLAHERVCHDLEYEC